MRSNSIHFAPVAKPTRSTSKLLASTLWSRFIDVSAIAAAMFAGASYLAQINDSPLMTNIARDIKKVAAASQQSLEQEEQRLVIQRGLLAALDRVLPEAERVRLGIDRLIELNEQQIAAVQRERAAGSPKMKVKSNRAAASRVVPYRSPADSSIWDRYHKLMRPNGTD